MELSILAQLVLLFLLSIFVNLACNRFKLPSTVGFLLTGVICGPSVLGLVSDMKVIDEIADIGVVMLMFTIGMELSGEALNRLKRPVFLGGGLQIGLVLLCCWGVGLWHGFPSHGIMWGCLMALSSSAIVLQLFQQKGISTTPVGRLGLAILVFQDIMAAPMIIAIPLISGQLQLSVESALLALGKVAGMGLGMFIFARYILDRLMTAVVRTRAREVVLLTILSICLGFALLTSSLGMSTSLGAFLAGLMLARSEYSMSVISDVLPYKDVFMSLFFISVGMLLNVSFAINNIGQILYIVALFIVLKTLFTLPAVLVQGYPLGTAIRTSICLAQIGEFSFVLAGSAVICGILDKTSQQFFLAFSVITMMLTPALINLAPKISAKVCLLLRKVKANVSDGEDTAEVPQNELSDHIIIIGFGFSGKNVADTAKKCSIPYTVLEMNPETVSHYQGIEPIAYGDASKPEVLEHLGIMKARVLAIAISDPSAVRAIVAKARQANPDVTIIARTRFVSEMGPLHKLGANYVIGEEFESSVELMSQVLSSYLIPRQDIDHFADQVRGRNNSMIRRFTHSTEDLGSLLGRVPDLGVQALRLEPDAPLCGKNLIECSIRSRFKVTVVAIYRDGAMDPSPGGHFVFKEKDVLYLFGTANDLHAFENSDLILPPAPEKQGAKS